MNSNIKFLYERYCGFSNYRKDIGANLYEAEHWADQNIIQLAQAYNYIKNFTTKISRDSYEKYSKERCFQKFNLAYCPICDIFLTKNISLLEKIKRNINIITKRKHNPENFEPWMSALKKLKINGLL